MEAVAEDKKRKDEKHSTQMEGIKSQNIAVAAKAQLWSEVYPQITEEEEIVDEDWRSCEHQKKHSSRLVSPEKDTRGVVLVEIIGPFSLVFC